MVQGMPSDRRSHEIAADGRGTRCCGAFPSKAGSRAAGNMPDESAGSERS